MSLSIAVVQYNIVWEDVSCNLNHIGQLISNINSEVDLIVLPEMFATGFSMNGQRVAQGMGGEVVVWLQQMADEKGVAIMGSQAIADGDFVYNRALFAVPRQPVQYYDKRHVFSPGGEHLSYCKGSERVVFNYKGLRILPQICYDLRFPVWSRNRNDYDLAVYMANWPAARQHVWNALIKARAIENQCYVCAVNRVGVGDGIQYVGESQVVDYKGNELVNLSQRTNAVGLCDIDVVSLQSFKDKFPTYLDSDYFKLIID